MRTLKCGCTVQDQYSSVCRCPNCNKFLFDLFLAEPFPRGYDSPIRELLRKIYGLNCVASNTKFRAIRSNQKLKGIESAIGRSKICFFDVTGEIFNVAYEFGLALTHFVNPEQRKYIIVGSSESRISNLVLYNQMNIIKTLKPDKQLAEQVFRYTIKEDYTQLNPRDIVESCDKVIRELTTIYNDETTDINELNEDFYPDIQFPSKKYNKEILILTPRQFQHYYDDVNFPSNNEPHFLNFNAYFQGSSDMPTLIKNICENIISKYDYIIVHLLNNINDGITSARRTNFQAGVISGMMRGLKRDFQCDYYIKHENSKYPVLRCSDIPIFDKYTRHNEISHIVNDLIESFING